MDIYKKNQNDIDELVQEIYNKIGYVDHSTIREIILLGIQFDQGLSLGYIGKPIDALNYLKESNNIIEYLLNK